MDKHNSDSGHFLKIISSETRSVVDKRQIPRLRLSTSEFFKLEENHKVYAVHDISDEGFSIRILDPEDLAFYQIGKKINGELKVKNEKYSIQAEVRHTTHDVIGLFFKNPSELFLDVLKKLLNYNELAKELKEVPSFVKGNERWFRSHSLMNLVCSKNKIFFHWGSHYVQWTERDGLETGEAFVTSEPGIQDGVVQMESLIIYKDITINIEKINESRQILVNSSLSEEVRKKCLDHLVSSS